MNIKITVNINKEKNYNNLVKTHVFLQKSTFKQAYDKLRLVKLNKAYDKLLL